MIGTKYILHYLLKKPTNGEVQVCADAATSYSTALSIYITKLQQHTKSAGENLHYHSVIRGYFAIRQAYMGDLAGS